MKKSKPTIISECLWCQEKIYDSKIRKTCSHWCTSKYGAQKKKDLTEFITKNCPICSFEFTTAKSRQRTTCNDTCLKEHQIQIGKTIMGNRVNPMLDPVIAAKMSKTRRETVTNDPAYRKARSEDTAKNWADGKHDGSSTGKCKWYDHQKPDGSITKLQGTWEVAFAREMDARGIDYVAHRGRWEYVGHDGSIRSYYPDFYILMWDGYVDVKGAYWDELQETKFEYIKKSHPDKCVVIGNKEALKEWNVDYAAVQRELL